MNLQDLNKKLVAILGYGQEGKAVTAYLIRHGITPVLFDQKPWEDWDEIEKLEIKKLGINFIFGPDCFKELAGFDVAFRSPGIRLSSLQLSADSLQMTSQTKWFFEHCPAKIIGVTGTKGKGTTASLIYAILRATHYSLPTNCYLTGNIGKIQSLEILDYLMPEDWVVYELSSFQLQDLDRSPHIGVVLMVTQEHLDYHASQEEYVEAKSAITKFQTAHDTAVINADFESSIKIGKLGKGKKLYYTRKINIPDFDGRPFGKTQGGSECNRTSRQNRESEQFSLDCFVTDNQIIITEPNFQFPIPDLQLKGRHNLENVCAAILAARRAGASDEVIKKAIMNFKGLEHRLEFVDEKNGIKFYNDSFSTTPETAIAAIKAFTEPEILILGGSSKHADFTDLGRTITGSKNIKAVILIGQEAGGIKSAIQNAGRYQGKIFEGAKNMGEIFDQIKSISEKGNVVVLSPACASFDMFKNYEDRGEQFKLAVMELM
jgi:UDP-N-acetylmuramoylalanine--D-glutamate ligase